MLINKIPKLQFCPRYEHNFFSDHFFFFLVPMFLNVGHPVPSPSVLGVSPVWPMFLSTHPPQPSGERGQIQAATAAFSAECVGC